VQGLLARILALLREKGPMGPGDAVAALGEPRYRVLSAFHCLEELGLARKIYERGTYKVYTISLAGEALLEEAASGATLASIIEEALTVARAPAGAPGQASQEAP